MGSEVPFCVAMGLDILGRTLLTGLGSLNQDQRASSWDTHQRWEDIHEGGPEERATRAGLSGGDSGDTVSGRGLLSLIGAQSHDSKRPLQGVCFRETACWPESRTPVDQTTQCVAVHVCV